MHPDDVKDMVEAEGGEVKEMAVLPDGHGFAVASFELPADHWLYSKHDNVPPMGMRMGTADPRREEMWDKLKAAARYGVRCATMNGTDDDFDPDALANQVCIGLLGYNTPDGLSSDDWANPPECKRGKGFEVGKFYQHTSGLKMSILGRMPTTYWGATLIAETDDGALRPVGDDSCNMENWCEISVEQWRTGEASLSQKEPRDSK